MPNPRSRLLTDLVESTAEIIDAHTMAGRFVVQIDFSDGPAYYGCTIYDGHRLIAAAQGEDAERTIDEALIQARFSLEHKQYPGDSDAR